MTYLLDTSALLAHFRKEPGHAKVQALFDDENSNLLLSSVSIAELARRLLEIGVDEDEMFRIVARYSSVFSEIVSLDPHIALKSLEVTRQSPLRIPLVDSLIAATCAVRGATLVHRDAHMRSIPSSVCLQLDLNSV